MDFQTAVKAELDRLYGAIHADKIALTYLFAAIAKQQNDPKGWLSRAADDLGSLLDKPISDVAGDQVSADTTLNHARDHMERLQDTLKKHVL